MNTSILVPVLFLTCLCAMSDPAGIGPLKVGITVPARITDGDPLLASVTIRNVSIRMTKTTQPDPRDVSFEIRQVKDGGTRKLVTKQESVRLSPQRGGAILAPAEEQVIHADVLHSYPFGVAPGSYEIRARYSIESSTPDVSWHGTVESGPVTVEVLPQEGRVYSEFLKVSESLTGPLDQDTAESALAFARLHPKFVYTAPLLSFLLYRLPEAYALRTADLLLQSYEGTPYADSARREKERILRTAEDREAREAYLTSMNKEAQKPENAAVRAAVENLGRLLTSRDFARFENFLREHPQSFFSAEARWATIQAVQDGLLPPGHVSREAVLRVYYRDLTSRFPGSYRAQHALRDPYVRFLLNSQAP